MPRVVRGQVWLLLLLWGIPGWVGSTAHAAGDGKPSAGDPSIYLFTNRVPVRVDLQLSDDAYEKLSQYQFNRATRHQEREDVPATVTSEGVTYTNVAVHVKGGLGSFRALEDDQVSLTLNFGKLAPGQRFHGLRKLSLNSSLQDPSLVSERLAREWFAAAGVPVPRAGYAVVRLNGRPLGLRVLTEGWDKTFLERHFPDGKGILFDNGPTARDLGDSGMLVADAPETGDFPAITNAVRACKTTNLNQRLAAMERVVNLDALVSLYAVDSLGWNWDGFTFNRNNWRGYAESGSGRMTFMPHGLDQMFWRKDAPVLAQAKCLPGRALLEVPGQRERFLARIRELRTSVFDFQTMSNRAVELSNQLRPALTTAARRSVQASGLRIFLQRMAARMADVDQQLAGMNVLVPVGTNWVKLAQLGTPWRVTSQWAGGVAFTSDDQGTNGFLIHSGAAPGTLALTKRVWLEAGTYTIEGRIRAAGIVPDDPGDRWHGAGFSAWSDRKRTIGASWGWFPFGESSDLDRRGELVATNAVLSRIRGDVPWQVVRHNFELRNPVADIELRCVVQRATGDAWFDLDSIRLRRRGR